MANDITSAYDLDALNAKLEEQSAPRIIAWAAAEFGESLALSSSFGADSAVMLHLATRVMPNIKIITLDTGFLFPETIRWRDELAEKLKLNLCIFRPAMTREQFIAEHGQMWRSNPDACCAFNKREPFSRAKRELGIKCWLTGIRRDQSETRKCIVIVQTDNMGLLKLCPIAKWTARDVHQYLVENGLPYHPLRDQGYPSIGCCPEEGYCTSKVKPGEDPRSGRWAGFDKTECGLHTHEQGGGI